MVPIESKTSSTSMWDVWSTVNTISYASCVCLLFGLCSSAQESSCVMVHLLAERCISPPSSTSDWHDEIFPGRPIHKASQRQKMECSNWLNLKYSFQVIADPVKHYSRPPLRSTCSLKRQPVPHYKHQWQ